VYKTLQHWCLRMLWQLSYFRLRLLWKLRIRCGFKSLKNIQKLNKFQKPQIALVKCHQSCPCGTLCPWGCPCPGFCNEAANQTALIFTHKSYNGEVESDPFLLKWIGVEIIDDDNWLHTEPVLNEIPNFQTYPNTEFHSECFAVYKGQQFVLGGEKVGCSINISY